MKTLTITRNEAQPKQTLGMITLSDWWDQLHSLELPWLDNRPNVSCIPTGEYDAIPCYMSSSGRWALLLLDVPGRSEIMIHAGNYYTDIRGCILPGVDIDDINNDGIADVTQSAIAMRVMKSWLGSDKKIKVVIV